MQGLHIPASHIFDTVEHDGCIERLVGRRLVNNGRVVAEGQSDKFPVEPERRQIPFLMILPVLIAVGEIKTPDRLTEGDAQGSVDFRQHFLPACRGVRSVQDEPAQLHGILPQEAVYDGQEAVGMF